MLLLANVSGNCREADESRLREVCENFLGPPIGMAESGSDVKAPAWDPSVLVRAAILFLLNMDDMYVYLLSVSIEQ